MTGDRATAASQPRILASMTDLLLTGKTAELETSPRVIRPIGRRTGAPAADGAGRWHDPHEFVDERAVDEFRLLVRSQRRTAGTTEPVLKAERMLVDAAGVPAGETAIMGTPRLPAVPVREPAARGRVGRRPAGEPGRTLALGIEVVWGDVTRVASDVCGVGHYQGVEPQNAELAIDRNLVTGGTGAKLKQGDDRLVLTRLTHRGVIRGTLGQIAFFPAARGGDGRAAAPHTVAVEAGQRAVQRPPGELWWVRPDSRRMIETDPIFLFEMHRVRRPLDDRLRAAISTLEFTGAGLPGGDERPRHFDVVINPYDIDNGVYVTAMYRRPFRLNYPKPPHGDPRAR